MKTEGSFTNFVMFKYSKQKGQIYKTESLMYFPSELITHRIERLALLPKCNHLLLGTPYTCLATLDIDLSAVHFTDEDEAVSVLHINMQI